MALKTAPVIDIQIGGQTRKLWMGFWACNKLGLNPYKPADLQELLREMSVDKAVQFVLAGIENAVLSEKDPGGELPTAEDVIRIFDPLSFLDMFQRALGIDPDSATQLETEDSLPNRLAA